MPEAPGARGRAHVAGLGPCPRRTPPAGRLRSGAPSPRAGRRGREHLPGSPRPVLASSQAGRACGWEQPWAQGKGGAPEADPQSQPPTPTPRLNQELPCPQSLPPIPAPPSLSVGREGEDSSLGNLWVKDSCGAYQTSGPFSRWRRPEAQRRLASCTKNSTLPICRHQHPQFFSGTPQGVFITTVDQLLPLFPYLGSTCQDAWHQVDLSIRSLGKGFRTVGWDAMLVCMEQMVRRTHCDCLGEWGSAHEALPPPPPPDPENPPSHTPEPSSASALLAFAQGGPSARNALLPAPRQAHF